MRSGWRSRVGWIIVIPVLVWGAGEDVGRGAWVHLVATGVLLVALAQPSLSPRRRWLEYLAFGLFQVSMAVAVRGIAERGTGTLIAVLVAWAVLDVVIVVGHRRYLRHLQAEAERAGANAAAIDG